MNLLRMEVISARVTVLAPVRGGLPRVPPLRIASDIPILN